MLPVFHTNNQDLSLLQTKWSSLLNPLLSNPITHGQLLPNVQLLNGTTVINHRLGKKLSGWFIVGISANASIHDNQASNQKPELTLSLTSNAAVTVSLWCF